MIISRVLVADSLMIIDRLVVVIRNSLVMLASKVIVDKLIVIIANRTVLNSISR